MINKFLKITALITVILSLFSGIMLYISMIYLKNENELCNTIFNYGLFGTIFSFLLSMAVAIRNSFKED